MNDKSGCEYQTDGVWILPNAFSLESRVHLHLIYHTFNSRSPRR